MNNNEFYEEVARILGAKHEGNPFPYHKRTRWNNRTAGRGRYPNHGFIRIFGDTIHSCLHTPQLQGTFDKSEFLAILGDIA